MKKIMIISIFVLALAINASAECGDMHTGGRCLVDHQIHEAKMIQQEKKIDIPETQDALSITSILDYFKVQIISIIR